MKLVLCPDKEQNNLRLYLNISALKSLGVATAMSTPARPSVGEAGFSP